MTITRYQIPGRDFLCILPWTPAWIKARWYQRWPGGDWDPMPKEKVEELKPQMLRGEVGVFA